jgi:predicted amidohydrolase
MSAEVKVACIQANSGPDIDENLKQVGSLIRDAAKDDCDFIVTPENTDFMRESAGKTIESAMEANKHPGIPFFSFLAKELGIWLLIGSMKIKVDNRQVVNRSFLFRDTGQLVASYDKIHLFDVDLPNGEKHRESDSVLPGDKAVVVNTPWKKLGMSICYDVRFPYLYRAMAQREAMMMAVPSAFTAQTGAAHWEVLLRARAIETGSFILAPAQCGKHEGGRETFGHSMIIGPWGKVLAEKTEDKPGFISRKIDLLDAVRARTAIPSLQHDRTFDFYKTKDML